MPRIAKAKPILRCFHCGDPIPPAHDIYGGNAGIEAVLRGERPVFCSRQHGTLWRHANDTPAKKKAIGLKIATTRKNRSPKEKAKSRAKLRITVASQAPEFKLDIRRRIAATVAQRGRERGAEIVRKREATLIARYGDDYGHMRVVKAKATMQARYGSDTPLTLEMFRKKQKQTNLSRYGVEHATQNPIIKARLVDSYVKNNGGMGRASKSAAAKYAATMIARHGASNPMYVTASVAKCVASFKREGAAKALLTKQRNGTTAKDVAWKGHVTKKQRGTYHVNNTEQAVLHRLRALLGKQVVHLYRDHPGYPWEADFFDPKTETLYEYQGYFTHGGEPYDPKNKEHRARVRKLKAATDKWASSVTLKVWTQADVERREAVRKHKLNYVEWFTLEEFDLWFDRELAKRVGADKYNKGCFRVGSKWLVAHDSPHLDKVLPKNPVVYYPWDDLTKVGRLFKEHSVQYARKTEVKRIPAKVADAFCERFHLQGKCRGADLAVGLVQGKTLLGVMTFGKPRYNKRYDNELLRLCFSGVVVGGTQRMWKFVKRLLKGSVISYCDLAKFSGSVYTQLGFVRAKKPRPSVHWFNFMTNTHITDNLLRQRGFDQLVGRQEGIEYGKDTSNVALMRKHKFKQITDQGQAVFTWDPV